jgi:hypothetical protein
MFNLSGSLKLIDIAHVCSRIRRISDYLEKFEEVFRVRSRSDMGWVQLVGIRE